MCLVINRKFSIKNYSLLTKQRSDARHIRAILRTTAGDWKMCLRATEQGTNDNNSHYQNQL